MLDFFDFIKDWILNGIYDFAKDAFSWFLTSLITSFIQTVIFIFDFTWSVAKQVIQSLDVTGYINDAMALIPADARGFVAVMRIPEVINILLTGAVTKLALKFIPFL